MSATDSTPESTVEEHPVHPDSFDTGAGLDEAAEQPAQDSEAPSSVDAPRDPATGGVPAASVPAQNAPPAKPEDYEARYKSVEAWAAKVARENADLRKKVEVSAEAPPPAEVKPASKASAYDWDAFNKLAENEGREAAFAHRDEWQRAEIRREIREEREAETRQSRIDADAARLFQAHQVQPADIEVMHALSRQEQELGFNPSPGALLALRLGGGSWDETVQLIAAGKAAKAASPAHATPPSHPGAPGSQAPRSPADTGKRRNVQVTARSVGL